MLILAFDTTSFEGGAAIFRDSECLASAVPAHYLRPGEHARGVVNYSVVLFQMLDHLLAETGLKLTDIELFAVANGPGSFTGIRVGLAAALAWGQAFGHPVCGVSVLEAMVERARPETEWALPIADARRGEFFAAVFRPSLPGQQAVAIGDTASVKNQSEAQLPSQSLTEAAGPSLLPLRPGEGLLLKREALTALLTRLTAAGAVTCIVRQHDFQAQALQGTLSGREFIHRPDSALPAASEEREGTTAVSGSIRWQTVSGTLLDAIARLALRAHREGRVESAVDAYYIRRSDAELRWQDD